MTTVNDDCADTDIDYKQLTDGQHDPLEIIKPVLSHRNVSAVAKLAPYIHDKVITFFIL